MSDTTELQTSETLDQEAQPPPPDTELDNTEQDLTGRDAVMAAIIARRDREVATESGVPAEELAEEAAPEAESVPAEPEPASQPEPAAPEPDAVSQPQQQAPLRAVQMPDGRVAHLTEEQFAQLAMFGAQAATALLQPPQAAPQPVVQPIPQQPPAQSRPLVDDGLLGETVQKMQFGSPEEGKAALGALIQHVAANAAPAAPQIDPAQIKAAAVQEALQTLEVQRMTVALQQEFPEIYKDPRLLAVANWTAEALRQQAVAQGRQLPAFDIYREAGKQVYDLMHLSRPGNAPAQPTAPQAAPTVQRSAAVEERKRAAPRNPQPVDRRATMPETERAETASDVVNQLRQWRGQQPALA